MDKFKMYKKCVVSPTAEGRYRLKMDFTYKSITVPDQYVTNGANIPRVFWQIITPFQPSLLPAVVVHDYLCAKKQFKRADDTFEEMLKVMEIPKWKIYVLMSGVRVYHRVKYGVK